MSGKLVYGFTVVPQSAVGYYYYCYFHIAFTRVHTINLISVDYSGNCNWSALIMRKLGRKQNYKLLCRNTHARQTDRMGIRAPRWCDAIWSMPNRMKVGKIKLKVKLNQYKYKLIIIKKKLSYLYTSFLCCRCSFGRWSFFTIFVVEESNAARIMQ